MSDRALALVPNSDAKRKRGGVDGGDGDDEGAFPPGSVSDPSLALVVPATGGPAITKAEYEKRLKDVRIFLVFFSFEIRCVLSFVFAVDRKGFRAWFDGSGALRAGRALLAA